MNEGDESGFKEARSGRAESKDELLCCMIVPDAFVDRHVASPARRC